MQIWVDKQEKNPLSFSSVEGVEVISASLDTGDYWCKHKDGSMDSSVIERKEASDLFYSFTHKYENEKAKIRRAKEAGLHYILAIEDPAIEIRKGHSYWKNGEEHQVNKSGIAQVRQIMTIQRKYGIEVWWCSGRLEMAFRIQEYFLAGERLKSLP